MTDELVAPPDVQEYLRHLAKERDVSPNTVKAYERDLHEFVEFLGGYYGIDAWSWEGVDRLAMRGFLAHLSRRGVGKRTMARTLSGVRSFYRWMHRNEMVEANPARAVGAPKLDKYLPGYLDRPQIELLFQMAELRAMVRLPTPRRERCARNPRMARRSTVSQLHPSIP